MVKNLPTVQETQVTWVCSFPGQEGPLEEEMATLSNLLAGKSPRGAWWATVHRVTKSQTQLSTHACMQASIELHAEIFYKFDFSLFDKYSLHTCSVGHYAKCLE